MRGQAPRGIIVVGAVTHVEDLAHRFRAVAVAPKELRERDGIGVRVAEVAAELVETGRRGARAEEESVARRGADGLVAIRGVEAQAAPDEPVEMGRDRGAVAVGTQRGFQVIDEDEQNVGARGGGERGVGSEERDQEEKCEGGAHGWRDRSENGKGETWRPGEKRTVTSAMKRVGWPRSRTDEGGRSGA